jgi:hypothetical protein
MSSTPRGTVFYPAVAVLCLSFSGCHQAKSPDAVQAGVNAAKQEADRSIAKAQDREVKTADSADAALERAQATADRKKTEAAANTALVEAEGANKVALAQCETFSGDRQKACRSEADAELERAKAHAKEARAEN